jgi:regulator of replication initiation timing
MSIYDVIKDGAKALREADKLEEYKQLLELGEKLLELQGENARLKQENTKLKERLEIKEKLNYEYQAYWLDGDGPYCSKCYDKDKNLIRMIDFGGGVTRICPECKLGVDINK